MAMKTDHQIIRDYVTALDHLQYQNLPDGIVAVLVTHSNLNINHLDIRLDLHWTIEEVKEKLRKHVGTPAQYQRLFLKQNGEIICEMFDSTKMLGYYSVISGMEIHILDIDPFSLSKNGGLTDTSLIEKYKISDEKYDQRKGTMRKYIRQQKEKDPNFKLKPLSTPSSTSNTLSSIPEEIPGIESVEGITIGARCEIHPGKRRGEVMFIGEVEHLSPGYWVGVKFDEPVGKSDGRVKGKVIFECQPNYGGFIRGKNIHIGNYPVRDLLDDDDDEEDDNDVDVENENENDKSENDMKNGKENKGKYSHDNNNNNRCCMGNMEYKEGGRGCLKEGDNKSQSVEKEKEEEEDPDEI